MKAMKRRHARHYLLAALVGLALLILHGSLQQDRQQSTCVPGADGSACAYPPVANLGILNSSF